MPSARIRRAGLAAFLALGALTSMLPAAPAHAAPSTFGPVIGSALLCRSHLDNAYFQAYLTKAFGPSYKHEGGAYWFKADASLWGAPVSDVLISDDRGDTVFIGAVSTSSAVELEAAVRTAVGVRHAPADRSATPVRESSPGSRIVYFKSKSKIYCARYKTMPGAR